MIFAGVRCRERMRRLSCPSTAIQTLPTFTTSSAARDLLVEFSRTGDCRSHSGSMGFAIDVA
jgi:hypothetical protein